MGRDDANILMDSGTCVTGSGLEENVKHISLKCASANPVLGMWLVLNHVGYCFTPLSLK
jgi:hypothetical protein